MVVYLRTWRLLVPVRVQARVPVQGRELKANLGQQQEPPQPEQWPEALQQERQMEQEELQLEQWGEPQQEDGLDL